MSDTPVLDTDLLDRLSKKMDVAKVLESLDALPEKRLAKLFHVANGSGGKEKKPYAPPEPDADFYDLFANHLTDEQQEIRRVIRRFMLDKAKPVANSYWERGEMPFELVQPLAAALREALGENPAQRYCSDPVIAGLIGMEMPRVDPSLSTFLGVHWGLCLVAIHQFGSDEQKAK